MNDKVAMRPLKSASSVLFLVLAGFWGVPAAAQDAPLSEVQRASIERRAVEAAIWGLPAINTDLMLQAMLQTTDAEVNQVVYWGGLLDWHNQTLTPNPDTIYLMTFFDTRDGPVVIDIPPAEGGALTANINTVWQMPLEDAGLYGVDQGAGGKFAVLPPGFEGDLPQGLIPLQSDTFGGYALIRSNLPSHADEDVARAVEYGKRVQVYPLAEAGNPPPTVFVDAREVMFDATIQYDARLFDSLNRIVQAEPWLDRDRVMIDMLRTLGIEKGQPFAPSDEVRALLDSAAAKVRDVIEMRYEAGFPPYWDTSRWAVPALAELTTVQPDNFSDPNTYPVDARALTYAIGYVGIKRLGRSQFYLLAHEDADGEALDGRTTYRLTVPPDAPVAQYWSVTAYDRETHALILNMDRASRSSQIPELVKNPDGSVDVYFGPEALEGHEANWVPTDPDRAFELLFRLYGPTDALFDKSWVLPDIAAVE